MPERDGVAWRYVDDDPGAPVCADCGHAFRATSHRRKGDDHWCPECHPVKSLRVDVQDALAEIEDDRRDVVPIAAVLREGDPR
jgi:Zn finger protein HypA/HybF involved in hydrogenase expression